MNFRDWINESLRTHQERDSFARHTVIGRPVNAEGKTCEWCGREPVKGKLYQYTVESDGGRNNVIDGLFCCKDCMKSYHQ